MVYAQTKNRNLGTFGRILQWKMFGVCILWTFGLCFFRPFNIFYGHLVYFGLIWYIFPRFGILYQEKSGNPDLHSAITASKFSLFSDLKVRLRNPFKNESILSLPFQIGH
jgi:hypothetical protein